MNARYTLGLITAALVPTAAAAQEPLPLGSTTAGSLMSETPAEYTVELDGPGFLAVVLRADSPDDDLVLVVTDDEGQVLPSARSDSDLNGQTGAEQLLVQIPWGGTYGVVVEQFYSSGAVSFQVGASFLATPLAAADPDPDGKPSGAVALAVDETHDDSIDPAGGDGWDWYAITAETAGVLTILTRAVDDRQGDLRIDVFRADDLREAEEGSDQDQSGVMTNESVTVDVAAGETVYVKVAPSFMADGTVAYRIASGLIGG
ncbi:hypothetical protein V3331_05070 [Gaopeijia maritima]|uniref:hypothetical protein n=1 Tax=Gaopeijia maritima TaxID=3119007 RepID=UPI0032484C13